MAIFPRQKLSTKEKETRDDVTGSTWGENCVDFLAEETLYSPIKEEMASIARLVDNGELDEKDYDYVLNPLNTTIDRYKRFGARLRNFDIITPVRNLYSGEFSKRFKNVSVVDSNPDDDNRYKDGLTEMLNQYYHQQTINELNNLGLETGQESVEQPSVEEATNEFNRGFDSNRVISGQEILDYIRFDQDLDDKWQDAYNNWITFGVTATYKGIFNNDIDVEVVPPWELTFPTNLRSNFLEDCPWIVRRQVMNGNQIVDRWHDKLTSDDIDWLEQKENDSLTSSTGFVQLPTQYISATDKYNTALNVDGIEVFHVQWRSYRKIGLLTTINELGNIIEIEVDDTYTLNKIVGDISISWEWVSQVWEGWRIGDVERYIYIDVRPLPYNRMELNNNSAQKLSYNGRVNMGTNGTLISIPKTGRPYQMVYNILKYQFEKTVNKNKDKIAVIPQGLIPKGVGGWDEEKFMYFANADSMMVVDETSPTAGLAMQGIKVLDLSLGAYAKEAIELMQSVKAEWWEAIGMNRQRYGDSKASDGKGVTEQAIFRSAIISEELNRKFEKFQEKDYAGMLDISKLAFIDGKKSKYINSEGRKAFLSMNADDALFHLESDYNIHVINSSQETENIQMAKEYGFSIAQNADAPTMMELIGSKNFERTKEIIKKIDAMAKQREEAMQQQALKSNEQVAQMNAETVQAKNDVEIYKADKDYDKVIDAKLLDLRSNVDTAEPAKEVKDTTNLDNHKMNMDKEDLNLAKQKFQQDKKEGNQKILESKAKVVQLRKPTPSK